jgi:Double-GTPase 2
MGTNCREKDCEYPDVPCLMGHDDHRSCPSWGKDSSSTVQAEASTDSSILPWTSNTFGTAELSYLASQSRPKILGVIGAHNSGKTTFLANLYLLLHREGESGSFKFSRSFTLSGWENIAHGLRWNGAQPPMFPAHTTARQTRTPGLLHLGIRTADEGILDLTFTDAPGEWFQRWSVDEAAADALGARWIAENADAFALMIDSEALGGSERGQALLSFQLIAERLSACLRARPIQVIWCKSDIDIPSKTRDRLSERLKMLFPHAPQLSITAKPSGDERLSAEQQYLKFLHWIIEVNPMPILSNSQKTEPTDYFQSISAL